MNLSDCYPLGLGTFGYAEPSLEERGISLEQQKNLLTYALSKGINYVVAYLTYAQGRTAFLLSQTIRQYFEKNPDSYYLTFCAYPGDFSTTEQLTIAATQFLTNTGRNRFDCFMASSQLEGRFGREGSIKVMKHALDSGITKSLGLTNFSPEQLQHYYSVFGNNIVLHEICHNFEIRVFEQLGILKKHQEWNIKTVVYQPLRRNRTAQRNWPLLQSLAERYGATQNQIILAWLMNKGFLPLVKSVQKEHVDENCAALAIHLSEEDCTQIDRFVINWNIPMLNWTNFHAAPEEGVYVAKLPNVFDELHPNN